MLLSIIIPTLFRPPCLSFFKRNLDFLSNYPSPFDLEIIIVGSCESKNTSVYQSLSYSISLCKNVQVVFDGPSIYAAMNNGINSASGDFLYFCGDTDSCEFLNLMSLVNEASNMSNPPFVILASCLVGSKLFVADFPSLSPLRLAFESNPSHHQAIIYHRSLFDKFGYYDTRFTILSDYFFNLRLRQYLDLLPKPNSIFNLFRSQLILCECSQGGVSDTPKLHNYIELFKCKLPYLNPSLWFVAFLSSCFLFVRKSILVSKYFKSPFR